tara:strand:+ start:318 stop:563 length:246 start_codon:yes stop_codon:yes gene_type:complete
MKWNQELKCICGDIIKLDALGRNFEKHIKTNERHLAHLKKMWKIKLKMDKKKMLSNNKQDAFSKTQTKEQETIQPSLIKPS